jgi:hypothetical protein
MFLFLTTNKNNCNQKSWSTVIAMNMAITHKFILDDHIHRLSRRGDKQVNTDLSHLGAADEIVT